VLCEQVSDLVFVVGSNCWLLCSVFVLEEGGYRLLLLCVWAAKLSQFSSFNLKIGVFLLMMMSVGKRVMVIGKWSLPKRSSIRFQVVSGVSEGEQ